MGHLWVAGLPEAGAFRHLVPCRPFRGSSPRPDIPSDRYFAACGGSRLEKKNPADQLTTPREVSPSAAGRIRIGGTS